MIKKNNLKSLQNIGLIQLTLILFVSTACIAQTRWVELKSWQFRRESDNTWEDVVLPHSTNAFDGQSAQYYRGLTHYKTIITPNVQRHRFLYLMGAAQKAKIMLNNQKVSEHRGGYTPFCIALDNSIRKGENTLEILCDNTLDTQLAPVSSDFNKNNGLHNKAYIIETSDVFCDFQKWGYDALHVTPYNVSSASADICVNSSVCNLARQKKQLTARFVLRDRKGIRLKGQTRKFSVPSGGSTPLEWQCRLDNPHLWQGLEDPYLYTVELELYDGRQKIEHHRVKTGLRTIEMDSTRGFLLNGQPYRLRGFSMHQDWHGSASAVQDWQIERDFQIIKELGCNVLRLAHYPHNRHIFDHADSLGLIVQTEIPWVNECGNDTSLYDQTAYAENLHLQLREMIQNHYNHPSIAFWGLWNELGNIDGSHPQGRSLDRQAVLDITASLYDEAQRLDSTRFVGFADSGFGLGYDGLKHKQHFDYFAFNTYNGWYSNTSSPEGASRFANLLERLHRRAPYTAITEYGSGSNPFCHSLNPAKTTRPSVGGARHDEEWGNIVHERHLQILSQTPWLQFSTGWILFDFAVAARHEGFVRSRDGMTAIKDSAYMFLNDKGLVSRDRQVKKDAFYLYKAAWNKKEPTLYITSRRFTERPSDSVTIKVYSNLRDLHLYQNGRLCQILANSSEPSGVIYEFDALRFETAIDTFVVTAQDTQGRLIADTVAFSCRSFPSLHVHNRQLADSTGQIHVLHGVMDTPNPYFNNWRWGRSCQDKNIHACIRYFDQLFTALTDTRQGACCTVFRLHLDPCWTNDPAITPAGPDRGEANISQFSEQRLRKYLDSLYLPIIQSGLNHRLYIVVRPPGVCPMNIKVGGQYQQYLMRVWDIISAHPKIQQLAGHVSLELANEPVNILNADSLRDPHAAHDFFQPIVDKIRQNGFTGILWIPGAGWQSHYEDYALHPIEDNNMGYAVHAYVGWYGCEDNNATGPRFLEEFLRSVPVAKTHPILISEIDWSPIKEGQGHVNEHGKWVPSNHGTWATGTTSGWGNAFKYMKDSLGNISMTLTGTADLIDIDRYLKDGIVTSAFDANPEACAEACMQWYRKARR